MGGVVFYMLPFAGALTARLGTQQATMLAKMNLTNPVYGIVGRELIQPAIEVPFFIAVPQFERLLEPLWNKGKHATHAPRSLNEEFNDALKYYLAFRLHGHLSGMPGVNE